MASNLKVFIQSYFTQCLLSSSLVKKLYRYSYLRLNSSIHGRESLKNTRISPFVGCKGYLVPFYEPVVISRNFYLTESSVSFSNSSVSSRNMSSYVGDNNSGNVNYEQLIKLKDQENVLVIDVREKNELQETGTIPGSFNIPVGEVSDALNNVRDEVFEEKYGFKKPSVQDTIIFSCRSGKRSLMAQEHAVKAGYRNSLNFTGGWLEWEEKTGFSKE